MHNNLIITYISWSWPILPWPCFPCASLPLAQYDNRRKRMSGSSQSCLWKWGIYQKGKIYTYKNRELQIHCKSYRLLAYCTCTKRFMHTQCSIRRSKPHTWCDQSFRKAIRQTPWCQTSSNPWSCTGMWVRSRLLDACFRWRLRTAWDFPGVPPEIGRCSSGRNGWASQSLYFLLSFSIEPNKNCKRFHRNRAMFTFFAIFNWT